MSKDDTSPTAELSKLRHDFANDINCLKMNLDAIHMVRADPEEVSELVRLMECSLQLLQERINATLKLIQNS
jgi:hypothetical protein